MARTRLDALIGTGPLLADGGTGASFVDRGVRLGECFDALNLTRSDLVSSVHDAFVAAGAKVVFTNTFGANRFDLGRVGLADAVGEICRAGVEIARSAGVAVAGSAGPLRARLAPVGRVSKDEARAAYAEQIGALAQAGCDIVVVETQSDLAEMLEALRAAREVCDLPVIVSATFTRDDRTLLGHTPEAVAQALDDADADGIGVNCSQGPAQVLRLLRRLAPNCGGRPVLAKPNAGGPAPVGDRILWASTPAYVAERAVEMVEAGASIVGGCCGTRPDHVAAIRDALAASRPARRTDGRPATPATIAAPRVPVVPVAESEPTRLQRRLDAGAFVVTAEVDPPRGYATERLIAGVQTLADAGVHAVNVTGSSRARVRMSPWAPCRLIADRVGVETILTFPTRGRSLLRIQGDLLGAHALSIRNIFVVMGDPTSVGGYPRGTDAGDVVPSGLIDLMANALNQGVDQSGEELGEPTSFVPGCAVNPNAPDPVREARVLHRKIAAGARFALSQPVFAPETWRGFVDAYEQRHGSLELPVFVGVQPLVTARHAEFLHNEVPGYSISQEVRDRLWSAGDGASAEGRRLAVGLCESLAADVRGVYVFTPFSRFDLVADIVEAVVDHVGGDVEAGRVG